ncbi:hypothetical protein [Dyadobacter sandarakinus]|uniref:Uncharacterized protein n=1 Tax=Dyadobacter sandarakinus TaxID=2747268 RepID=A0ABX7I4F6_9BACT|nr:hypothetical protein [Dyadobacter sandarakinus]QRR00655.1 hypothetical protein HWI92_06905 [Dyadobacter sandarakinus]
MKNFLSNITSLAFAALVLVACETNKEEEVKPEDAREYRFIRVMVNDETARTLSLVDPVKLTVETFEAGAPKAALYRTEAGRFGALVHGTSNFVQFFDSGLEGHGDHVDVAGTPKWAALTGTGNRPTHFKSKSDEVITFNDGDGTLSVAREADFHTANAKMEVISFGGVPHHGAMTRFNNGTYAVTEKDGSVPGTLPERVRVIDRSGRTLFASTIQTAGIHGNASDGNLSLFGSASGILVVDQSGRQRLIAYPADFGDAWFGSVLEAGGAGKFIGFTAAKGAYLIDPGANTITPIHAGADVMQAKVDYAGNQLIVLTHSGEVHIYDLKTNGAPKRGSVLPATASEETQKPQLEATSRFLYITQPKTGELLVVDINDFSRKRRVKVSSQPYRLAILGQESDAGH